MISIIWTYSWGIAYDDCAKHAAAARRQLIARNLAAVAWPPLRADFVGREELQLH